MGEHRHAPPFLGENCLEAGFSCSFAKSTDEISTGDTHTSNTKIRVVKLNGRGGSWSFLNASRCKNGPILL